MTNTGILKAVKAILQNIGTKFHRHYINLITQVIGLCELWDRSSYFVRMITQMIPNHKQSRFNVDNWHTHFKSIEDDWNCLVTKAFVMDIS